MRFQAIERAADSAQRPLTPAQVDAIYRRAFGEHVRVAAAVELGDGMYNTTFRIALESGEETILRAAPEPARQFRSERAFLRNEHAAAPYFAPIAALLPRTLVADFTRDLVGRDYVIQSVLPGVPAPQGLAGYDRARWTSFFRQLGEISRRIHDVRGPGFGPPAGPLRRTWSEALGEHLGLIAADLDDLGLDAADVRELAAIAERRRDLLNEISEPRLLHGDLWTINVMVEPDAPEPAVSGVFDCDRAWWGDPESDWAIYRAAGRPGTERDAFWDGYGRLNQEPSARWRRLFYEARFLAMLRLERYRLGSADGVAASYGEIAEAIRRLDDLEPPEVEPVIVDREVLVGGVNEVVREGDTVRRPAGPWSRTVQRLLAHLAADGFEGAPVPLGFSDDGTEELVTYLPGEIGHDFAAPEVRSDASLVAVAKLLRRLHDASATFARSDADVWYMPVREPAEVICHGDAATYNTVFRDGVPAAFIDFDTAHPAPRIWDAAYTAYRFVPLYAPDEAELTLPVDEARRRLALFTEAYGLGGNERAALPAVAAERLRAHVELMRNEAAAGNAAFASHLAEGHDRRYLTDAEWIERVYGGVLRTERLTLRPVRPDTDQTWLLDHWTELDVRRFLHDGETLTPEQIGAEVAESVRSFAEDGYGLWVVEVSEFTHGAGTRDRRHRIGTVGIRPLDDLGPELYYSLAPDAWGRGYATEAARVVLAHALGPLGLPELLAEVDIDNRASEAIIAKLGMESFDVVPGVLGPMTRYRTVSSPDTPL